MAVPVSAVAPNTDDVPKMGSVGEASEEVRSDEEARFDCEALDEARLEVDNSRLEEEAPDELLSELDVSPLLEAVEVLIDDSVVGDEEAVAATETSETTEPIIDVTWV